MYDEGFSPKPLMLHLARFEQLMNVSELGSKVSLLRACISTLIFVMLMCISLGYMESKVGLD